MEKNFLRLGFRFFLVMAILVGVILGMSDKNNFKRDKLPFYISLDTYKYGLYYSDEINKTMYEIQQIPKKLNKLEDIQKILFDYMKPSSSIEKLEKQEEILKINEIFNKMDELKERK